MEKRPAAGQGLRPQRASEAADESWRSVRPPRLALGSALAAAASCQDRVQTLSESSRRTQQPGRRGACCTELLHQPESAAAPPGAHTFVASNPEACACINAPPWCR